MERFVILLCLCFSSSGEFIISDLSEITEMRNLRLSDLSGVKQTDSVVECAVQCANQLSCESLSYHSSQGLCQMHVFTLSNDTTGLISEDNWNTYQFCRGDCPASCGYVYNQTLDWCYRFVKDPKKNASQAVEFCRDNGGRMLRITSSERNVHIENYFRSNGIWTAWIGGFSPNKDDNFVYEDGSPVSYLNWLQGEPRGQRYIRLRLLSVFEWINMGGSAAYYFMCER
ncbi:alpha-N-acetylgalactosamine-specific lectin-like [Argopecten irradians]|uniref:alpha-N-acetylgalactosamine-specific lectin-like n=1 Tax=Argopecten irradians TaxID=31199 RepID=UPI00371E9514